MTDRARIEVPRPLVLLGEEFGEAGFFGRLWLGLKQLVGLA